MSLFNRPIARTLTFYDSYGSSRTIDLARTGVCSINITKTNIDWTKRQSQTIDITNEITITDCTKNATINGSTLQKLIQNGYSLIVDFTFNSQAHGNCENIISIPVKMSSTGDFQELYAYPIIFDYGDTNNTKCYQISLSFFFYGSNYSMDGASLKVSKEW